MQKDYDLIIVGGGLVGLTLACALGGSHLKIAVIDAHPPAEWIPGQVERVSAITRASQHILESLDVWSKLPIIRMCAYQQMEVWEKNGSSIHFNSAEIGEDNLGYIIENQAIQLALLERIQTFNNITLLYGVNFHDFSCTLLVGADGAQSAVRQYAGISTTSYDYQQSALVTTVQTGLEHHATARQIFLPDGTLAFLPLADPNSCSIVWATSPERAQHLADLPSSEFKHQLTETFEHCLGQIIEAGECWVFPLRMQHADNYVQPGIALIGDSAHTLHPLAGQGLNLGLLDAACLSEVLLKAKSIGSLSTLRRYERWRKGHNWMMIAAMQGFRSLFGSTNPCIQQIRSLGLQITDHLPFVKHLFMRQAMGLTGDLPKLACGDFSGG